MLEIESLSDNSNSPLEVTHQGTNVGKPDERGGRLSGLELIITQMTSGARDINRVNVFVNNKFALSLDVKQVVDLGIKVGKKLSKTELQELQVASEFGKLYQRALEWALIRPRSVGETREYLQRRQVKRSQLNRKREREELKPLPEIQVSAISLVVERLSERGYIDDQKFAEFYVENRFAKKGISIRRLEQELRRKHISEEIIRDVLGHTSRDERGELAKMIAKKRQKYDDQKLIAYLVRQGFDYQLVVDMVRENSEEV